LIDVIFDSFIGPWVPRLLAWEVYRALLGELVSLVEVRPISCRLYISFVFETTFLKTVSGIGVLALQLDVNLALQLAWTFGMYTVWLQAGMSSNLLFQEWRICGNYCVLIDLAGAIPEIDYCVYSVGDNSAIADSTRSCFAILRHRSTLEMASAQQISQATSVSARYCMELYTDGKSAEVDSLVVACCST